MTTVDIAFQCRATPSERQMVALDLLREVYGVRRRSVIKFRLAVGRAHD